MSKVSYSLVELNEPTKEQIDVITSLLQTAFHSEDDRVVITTLAGGPGKEETFYRSVVVAGRVVAAMKEESDQIIGCAIWYKPNEDKGKVNDSLEPDPHDAPWPELARWKESAAKLLKDKSTSPNVKQGDRVVPWHLNVIALHPQYQGLGIGRALIEDGKRKSKGAEISLHASNEQNVGFYNKLGFNLVERTPIHGPHGNFTYHLLVLPPN